LTATLDGAEGWLVRVILEIFTCVSADETEGTRAGLRDTLKE
jgi:hypothetical protein